MTTTSKDTVTMAGTRRWILASSRHVRKNSSLLITPTVSHGSYLVTRDSAYRARRQLQSASLFPSFSTHSHLHHDLGGQLDSFGPIPPLQELLAWEQQCHSLFAVLASKQIVSTDELRRAIESLTPDQYITWTYYEKWSAAMAILLLEHGVITHEELQIALFGTNDPHDLATMEPRFQQGNEVRVKRCSSSIEWKRPHIRTPGYIFGVSGVIERVCGVYKDPSFLAFGLKAPAVQLYRVQFEQGDIWPEHDAASKDVVEVEVYEHWLEPLNESEPPEYSEQVLFDHSGQGDDCLHHHHGHDDHIHEARPAVEERAIRREGPPRPGQELFQALFSLLLEKDIVAADDVRLMCERMDTAGMNLDGATLVVNAWVDPSYRARLVDDPSSAATELGISTSNPNAPTVLTVVENTPDTHNLVVCTLCSCYPSGLLGIAPSWYKSREYRARAVREPRKVLKEFGVSIPYEKKVRVHDSTADHRYLVLPERPPSTDDWSKEELKAIITRDSMIGVALPKVDK